MAVIRAVRVEQIKPQVPEIGRIYKGAPKKLSSKGKMIFGDDLDHFRFEPDERLKASPHSSGRSLFEYLEERWKGLEGQTGGWRSLPVRFPFQKMEDCFYWKNEAWATVSGKEVCVRRCDGSICTKYLSENAEGRKVIVNGAIACAMGEDDTECPMGCKATGRLRFMLPALGYPGMLLLTTHSGKDILEILANLMPYQHMDLSAIPFRLFRRFDDCDRYLPDGSVQRQKKWLLHLEIDPQFGMLAIEGKERKYRAELSGYVEPQRSLPSRSVAALPPSRDAIMQSDDWVMFVQQVQHCIQSSDRHLLNEVIQDALLRFPQSVHEGIYREQERAMGAIAEMGMAQPVTVQSAVQPASIERLSKLREMTGHSKGQCKAIAKGIGLDVAQCAGWNDEQITTFRDAIFVDWCMRSLPAEQSSTLVEAIAKPGLSDEQIFAELQDAIAPSSADLVEAEAEVVEEF